MAVTFPDWYDKDDAVPQDAEYLIKNFFAEKLPDTIVNTWLPAGDIVLADITSGKSYLRIFRVGGPMSLAEGKSWFDQPRIQFAALAPTRDESWDIITFIRTVLWTYRLHPGRMSAAGIYAMVKTIGEVEGPEMTPVQFRDERLVPVTFDLEMQRKKGLPDYRIPLGL